MQYFLSADFIPQAVNVVIAVANIYWSLQLKQIQTSRAMIDSLREENREKDELIERLQTKKNEYKMQYQHQLSANKQMEGQLHTYEKLHRTSDT